MGVTNGKRSIELMLHVFARDEHGVQRFLGAYTPDQLVIVETGAVRTNAAANTTTSQAKPAPKKQSRKPKAKATAKVTGQPVPKEDQDPHYEYTADGYQRVTQDGHPRKKRGRRVPKSETNGHTAAATEAV